VCEGGRKREREREKEKERLRKKARAGVAHLLCISSVTCVNEKGRESERERKTNTRTQC